MRPYLSLYIKVAHKLVLKAATHTLKLDFDTIPMGFHVLSVNPCGAIHKFNGVIHYSMATNVWETSNPVVRCPLIRPHNWLAGCLLAAAYAANS